MTEVQELTDAQGCAAWDTYVDAHPHGTLFHLTPWKQAIERTYGHRAVYLWTENAGRITGLVPLFLVPTLKGKALVSVPYAVYGGILADDPEIEQHLLRAVHERAKKDGVKYVEFRDRQKKGLGLPESSCHVTFERALPERPEDCLAQIPRKSRASVRNGRKKYSVHTEFSESFTRLHELYAQNVRRLGSPTIPFRLLENLKDAFGDRLQVMNALYEDRVVSSVLIFYYKDTVIPYYSGSDSKYFFTQCINVMYCDLMEDGVRRGMKRFDFGRSRREVGPYFFKVNMGFEPSDLHYQYLLLGLPEVPRINPSNPKFDLPRRIWSRLPLGVTKVVGPRLLKYIP